jgi:Uma2 family endonuclease
MSGSKQVWLVDPQGKTVTVYKSLTDVHVLRAEEESTGGDLLPELRCKVVDFISLP